MMLVGENARAERKGRHPCGQSDVGMHLRRGLEVEEGCRRTRDEEYKAARERRGRGQGLRPQAPVGMAPRQRFASPHSPSHLSNQSIIIYTTHSRV